MDPITISFFLAATFLVIGLILYMFQSFGKETVFEEAYGRSALRLLADDKSSKPKSSKSNRKNKVTAERRKETVVEKEVTKNPTVEKKVGEVQTVIPETAAGDDWRNSMNSDAKQRKKGKKRITEESPKAQEITDSQPNGKEIPVKIVEKPQVVDEQPVVEKNVEPAFKTAEKKLKKKKVQKLEDSESRVPVAQEEESVRENQVPVEATNTKVTPPKVRSSKAVPKEINENLLLLRIKEVDVIEPEYVSYLAKHFNDTSAQRKKLNEELETLKKQYADREKLVAQCNEKLAVLGKRDAEIEELRRIIDEERKKFSDEKANYSMFEKTVRTQLAQNIQEKKQMQQALDKRMAELGTMKQELLKANAAIHAPPPIDVVKQGDLLRNEVNSLKNVVQQREAELKQKNQVIEQMLSETKELKRKVDLLTQSNTLTTQRAQEIEAQAENARRSFEEKLQRADQTATELQVVLKDKTEVMERMLEEARRRAAELEKQVLIAENGVKESEIEKQRLLQENLHYKSDFSSMEEAHKMALDKMAQEMEEIKRQKAGNEATVSSQLKEANEKIATLSELNEKLEDVGKQLKKEIETMKSHEELITKKLNDERKKYEEMKAVVEEKENAVRILEDKLDSVKASANDVVESEIKKVTTGVQNAEPVASEAELSELKKRLLYQEQKNEELRASNYQLVEVSQKQEQNLLKKLKDIEEKNSEDTLKCLEETRRILQEVFRDKTIPPVPDKPELGSVFAWLQNAKNCCGDMSNATNHCVTPANNVDSTDKTELESKVERYRTALAAVSESIKVIEHEAAVRKRCYEEEIAQLKTQLAELKHGHSEGFNESDDVERTFIVKSSEVMRAACDNFSVDTGSVLPINSPPLSEEEWVVL